MEGATVRDRVKSLESNAQGSSSKSQLSPRTVNRSTNTRRTATSPIKADPSFAQRGALLSFQKRADTNGSTRLEPIQRTESPKPILPNDQFGSRQLTTSPESIKGNPQRPHARSTPERTQSVGALAAASLAARRGLQNSTSPTKSTTLNTATANGLKPSLQKPTQSSKTSDVELAAAKASVERSTARAPPEIIAPKPIRLDNFKMDLNSNEVKTTPIIDMRGTVAASRAVHQKNSLPLPTSPSIRMSPEGSSSIAARAVSGRVLPSPSPISEKDRESKFGVILSRTVSPAPEQRSTTPHDFGSIYSLPLATLSEPSLPTTNLSASTSAGKAYKNSKLGPKVNRPSLGPRHSSSDNSLADHGAATAFSSQTSSAVSLPLYPAEQDGTRKRPVHLKSTLRKERKPDKDKNQNVIGPQFLSEVERKRYEGVWASNHQQHSLALLSDDADYIDDLIVRELWVRSKLSREILAHIWDLVDHHRKGKLTREEFVVGMWLIDQSLAGRKLPLTQIPAEVWHSAQRLTTFTKNSA